MQPIHGAIHRPLLSMSGLLHDTDADFAPLPPLPPTNPSTDM